MNFLAKHGFDFKNNFIYGLSYERLANKQKCKESCMNNKPLQRFGFFLDEKSESVKSNVFKLVEDFFETPNKNKFEVNCETTFLARHLMK